MRSGDSSAATSPADSGQLLANDEMRSNSLIKYDDNSWNNASPQRWRRRFNIALSVTVISLVATVAIFITMLTRLPDRTAPPPEVERPPLWTLVTREGMMGHLNALQSAALANGGTRAVGTPGYDASVQYVVQTLRTYAPDYSVMLQNFTVPVWKPLSDPELEQVMPAEKALVYKTDFTWLSYSGSGNVTAPLVAADAYGCVDENFAAFPKSVDTIALIKRGSCTFLEKCAAAVRAGVKGVLIYNEGNSDDRKGLFSGTIGEYEPVPVLALPYALGSSWAVALSMGTPVHVRIAASTRFSVQQTCNVIAETNAGRDDRIIVLGSHLDSVPAGPGINDNGSGTSLNLQVAISMAQSKLVPVNRIRFGFWGAEEIGLVGSTEYVKKLEADGTLNRIALNLNFDMVASPNFFYGVYNGSSGPDNVKVGSSILQRMFQSALMSFNHTSTPTDFNGRSDYGPFIAKGIPASGFETGAEGVKNMELRSLYGGMAKTAFDPCYHQDCDTIQNISQVALQTAGEATGRIVEQLALEKNLDVLLAAV